MVAEKFEPLIRARAISRTLEGGNVRERAIEQRAVLESIANALLERGAAATAAGRLWSVDRRCFGGRGGELSGGRVSAPPSLPSPARVGGKGGGRAFAAAAHLTRVNNRSQRTSHGQRQISQACVPSLIEKKIICA